tara:strand:- start:321 stop:503 length:183 start_codon:yes stop_codon:yes gene_type:complete
MKPAKFETYKSKPNEFKIAQSRSANPFKPYVPTPHPFVERLLEHRNIPSMWTPGVIGKGK